MVLLTLAMAAVAEMGEVDELHSKEDVAVNGSMDTDVVMEKVSEDKEKSEENEPEEPMEVDETAEPDPTSEEETKPASPVNVSASTETTDPENPDLSSSTNEEEAQDKESNKEEDKAETSDSEKIVEINDDDDVQEINDDDDEEDEVEENKDEPGETIELNDSGGDEDEEEDVILIDTPSENGTDKKEKSGKQKEVSTPRRSSRNLNKSKSYSGHSSEESDIEEVLPEDPLACIDSGERHERLKSSQSTIVVKDTKRLVEIAAKSNSSHSGKKEPTLVIIDTNSILSGRGPVPVNNKPVSNSNYNVLPMALPAQGLYPANMRATITPIPLHSSTSLIPKSTSATLVPPANNPPPLLPTLTDDMFVVEAPSFIVPYVYEKPPVKEFRAFVDDYKTAVQNEAKAKAEPKDADDKDDQTDEEPEEKDTKKPYSYFESPLGKFFIDIGFNLVQEFVQSDLLKQQRRKRDREGGHNPETDRTIMSLIKNLEFSKENNEPYKMSMKKCEFCNYKTESSLAMSYHLETPHMRNFVYHCNFCPYEVRSPHDILFHMEAEHAVKGHLDRAAAFHQCPNCPFEDNQKGKLSRHMVTCARKFKQERNLEPPVEWEPPAKIPRVPKMRNQGLNATALAYQAMSKGASSQYQFLSKMQLQNAQNSMQRGRGRPTLGTNGKPQNMLRPSGMVFKQHGMSGGSVLVPTNYQLSGNQVFQSQNQKKPSNQPSISITPLPRASSTSNSVVSTKPGDNNSKNSFVICEICDGYIKDLEQLRNHMQWIHKIKIHPKMIYNRPPLNCQKCQFRFFTDQGLERHLLGSHGLVTSSMQDAANKSKDSGRCPVCGRVYQWKLLNHVARDHNMTLKPAHLSYKCTVCTATFGMYKQFENHVYSAHSVVAKRVMDKKSSASPNIKNELKPLKINDEITIIPQPAKSSQNGASKEDNSPSSSTGSSTSRNSTPGTSKSR